MSKNSTVNNFRDWILTIKEIPLVKKEIPLENIDLVLIKASDELLNYVSANSSEFLGFKSIVVLKAKETVIRDNPDIINIDDLRSEGFMMDKTPAAYYFDMNVMRINDVDEFIKRGYIKDKMISMLIANLNYDFPAIDYYMFNKLDESNWIIQLTDWARLHQILPVPTTDPGSKEWVIEMKKYYTILLSFCGVESDIINGFFTEDNIRKFIVSLTTPDKSMRNNYEAFEFYGDSNLSTAFKDYMSKKFVGPTARELTEFSNQFMSREYQQYFSDDLRISDWMIYGDKLPEGKTILNSDDKSAIKKFKTDIFESLIGVLKITGKSVGSSVGFTVVDNLVTILGNSLYFNPIMIYGIPKTIVEQMMAKMGLTKESIRPDYKVDRALNKKSIIIELPRDAFDKFVELGIDKNSLRKTTVVFEAKDSDFDESDFIAMGYSQFLDNLNSLGINQNYINKNFQKSEFTDVDAKLIQSLLDKTSLPLDALSFQIKNGRVALYIKDTYQPRGDDKTNDILAIVDYVKDSENKTKKSNNVLSKEKAIKEFLKNGYY